MQKHVNSVFPVSLLLAAAGFGIGLWSKHTGFEEGSRLAISGAPANVVLVLFSCVAVLVAVLLAIFAGKEKAELGYRSAFSGGGVPAKVLQLLGAACLVIYGLSRLQGLSGLPLQGRTWQLLQSVLAILAGIGLGAVTISAAISPEAKRWDGYALAPGALCFTLELVVYYMNQARDPVLMRIAWPVLALALCAYDLYCAVSFACGAAKTKRTCGGLFLGVYFCGVWLSLCSGWNYALAAGGILTLTALELKYLYRKEQSNGEAV